MDTGVERIVEQTVDPKIYTLIEPAVESVVYKFMGVDKSQEGGTQKTRSHGTVIFLYDVGCDDNFRK
jgi:hypothetical protein